MCVISCARTKQYEYWRRVIFFHHFNFCNIKNEKRLHMLARKSSSPSEVHKTNGVLCESFGFLVKREGRISR